MTALNFKKTYRFAVKSSLYITLFSTGLVGGLLFLFFTFPFIFYYLPIPGTTGKLSFPAAFTD